jgi:hypothetical protein
MFESESISVTAVAPGGAAASPPPADAGRTALSPRDSSSELRGQADKLTAQRMDAWLRGDKDTARRLDEQERGLRERAEAAGAPAADPNYQPLAPQEAPPPLAEPVVHAAAAKLMQMGDEHAALVQEWGGPQSPNFSENLAYAQRLHAVAIQCRAARAGQASQSFRKTVSLT